MAKQKVKQTLLIGALTSSFGVFVSKVLGLLYHSPLSALAGEANMSFYSISYSYYDILLKISGGGIPFAIAALVAKYAAKDDYKTVLLVKKLGTSIILGMSFIVGLFFICFSGPIAVKVMGSSASPADVEYLTNLFAILTIAVIIVPFLSSIRGYYQGLKRLDIYASSQVLEQFVRVLFILIGAFFFVKVLHSDSIYAIYMAMAAAAISAAAAIVFVYYNGKDDDIRINKLIEEQQTPALAKKEILKELIMLGLPYIIISFFGSASTLINSTYFLDYAPTVGLEYQKAKLSMGILQANCNKLLAIPQVLALGFSSGLVPYITESFEKRDFDKLAEQVTQIFKTVLFFLIPVLFVFFFFRREIYYVMYGGANLELGASLFGCSIILGFTDTVAPILSSIMITLRLRKQAIYTLIISFVAKFVTFFPCVKLFGAEGMVISTFLCSIVAICLYLFILSRTYGIKIKGVSFTFVKIIISSILTVTIGYIVYNFIPFDVYSRILGLIVMGILGIIMAIIYLFICNKVKLPKEIFDINSLSIRELINKFRM